MKTRQNEQGYALVTVLLIITIFMVIFLSFMGTAFSSVKQNDIVEKNSQSVAAAEMGVAYYQVEIQRMFESKQSAVNTYVSSLANPATIFKREATIKMASELQSMIPVGTKPAAIPIDGHPSATFSIENFKAVPDPVSTSNKVNISFDIIGIDDGKPTKLTTNMTIDLNTIKNKGEGGTSGSYTLPSYTNIPTPTGNECKILSCNPVYIKGDSTFPGGNNQLKKTGHVIYATGNIRFDETGNENGKSGLRIHAGGQLYIGQNINSTSNAIIETNGEAIFMQNVKLYSKSKLYAKKLFVKQNLELNDTTVYVGEDGATISGPQLKIDSLSKMCVLGNLTAPISGIDPNRLIVYGTVNGSSTSPYRVNDINLFKSKCGTQVSSQFGIEWDQAIDTIINKVDY